MARRDIPKADIETSIKEMIGACHRFLRLLNDDALSTGICKAMATRLSRLERELRVTRKKRVSPERLQAIGHEVKRLVGQLCKSLIHYLTCDSRPKEPWFYMFLWG